MKKIILASTSPRRRALMKLTGLRFTVIDSGFDERSVKESDPKKLVRKLAFEKANAVAKDLKNALVIGADTVLALNGEILGKPKDRAHAKQMLTKLSGQNHHAVTGFAIIDSDTGKKVVGHVAVKIKMKALSEAEIDAYIATGEPMDKAGSYAVQEIGGMLVEKIHGHVFDIIGLPLASIRRELKKFGIKILE